MYIKGRKITYGLTHDCDFPADISQEKDGTLTLILDTHEIKTNSHNFSFLKNCNLYEINVALKLLGQFF